MIKKKSMETPEITMSQNSEALQRVSAITDALTNNVVLSTMQALLLGITEMSQAMNKSIDNDRQST